MVCNDAGEAPQKQMIIICAWCRKELGRRWTTNGGVSHGICDECRAKLMKDREGGKSDVQLSAPSGIDCNVLNVKPCEGGTVPPPKGAIGINQDQQEVGKHDRAGGKPAHGSVVEMVMRHGRPPETVQKVADAGSIPVAPNSWKGKNQ